MIKYTDYLQYHNKIRSLRSPPSVWKSIVVKLEEVLNNEQR